MYTQKISLTRQRSLAISLLLFSVGAGFVYFLVQSDIEQQITQTKSEITSKSGDLRNHIENQIYSTLSLTLGSLVYVSSHPDLSQQEFAKMAAAIIRRVPFVLNMGLAKDNVISHIYPLEGNQAALGMRYMDNPNQKAAVLRAIEAKDAVLAGPIKLLQGGEGLINRIPIFLDDSAKSYWGIASIVIKMDEFYNKADFPNFSKQMKFALRGRDGLGANGAVFYGDPAMFENSRNVIVNIPVPNGSWQLVVSPLRGWTVDSQRVITLYIVGLLIVCGICGLIYQLLLANIKLEKEKNNVDAANEHKTRFFTYMTHELRTPLTSIFGVIRMLEGNKLKENESHAPNLIANASRNCQRLMHLINDILDLRRLELGLMAYNKEPVAVVDIVKDAMDEMWQYARQYSIEIVLEKEIEPQLMVNADAHRLSQVLVNLLANAIKFSPADSKVTVGVMAQGNVVCFSVTDCGQGVGTDKINTIFQEFVQSDREGSANRIPNGTGLGLAISKKLVEDQGGSLACFNAPQGGAIFYFLIPKYLNNQENIEFEQRKAS